ncbi:hypothetical protein MNV49_007110 [Pseudohyphozyma bogoriensis]|nr:hypothetical protein MNV49_007110 [Pseudohyphozyma bogoriensis]
MSAHKPLASNGRLANGAGTGTPGQVARHSRSKFPHRLNFYTVPPTDEITLEEFEGWAIDRLRVLADIEAAQARNRSHEELKTLITAKLKQFLPLSSSGTKGVDTEKERKKDLYSHFVLRLAFCRSEELRARFLKLETALFRIRFESDELDERAAFIKSLNFGWEEASRALPFAHEKRSFATQLAASTFGLKEDNVGREAFFKVHWTKVSDLVERRRVFIHRGQAYVPHREELSLVLTEFTSALSSALSTTARALPRLDEDTRLLPILTHLSDGFSSGLTSSYTPSLNALGEEVTAEMIPEMANQSFPVCMRSLQDTLRVSKHLKHEGRQQYNLFLKGIGLSVEEAIVFWRKSFSAMTDDKFNKEYKYNIRHGYGLEGSRKNYSPKSCSQIITGKSPGPGESHGCPFRHFSEQNLSSTLSSFYNLSAPDMKEILGHTKAGHYHLACTRLFEVQHARFGVQKGEGVGGGDSVDHPNRYVEASRKVMQKVKEEEEGKTKMEVD